MTSQHQGGLDALMRAAGWEPGPASSADLSQARRDQLLCEVLDNLNVTDEALRRDLADEIGAAAMWASFRAVSARGTAIKARDVIGAVKAVEDGLRSIHDGLATIAAARSTVSPGSSQRRESLEAAHHALLGAIADAVCRGLLVNVSHDAIADRMPSYRELEFSDPWRDVFALAAQRVKLVREAYDQRSYHAKKHDREEWFDRAIEMLAAVFERAKPGEVAKAYRRKDHSAADAPFVRFVREIWPLMDSHSPNTPPSDGKVRAALLRRRNELSRETAAEAHL